MKVLLVDDHPVMRLGIKTLLDEVEDVEVVSEAENADDALRAARRQEPDVVVLDPELGASTRNGLKTCRDLKSMAHPPKVLIYTAQNSRQSVAKAVLAGADAYVYKGAEGQRLPEIISRTGEGERTWILGSPAGESPGGGLRTRIEESDLTPKECEVLNLLIGRYGNQEIADRLYLSRNTVKTHVRHVLKKLGINNRRELFDDDSP